MTETIEFVPDRMTSNSSPGNSWDAARAEDVERSSARTDY